MHFPTVFPLTLQHSLARAGHGFAALADAVAQGLTTEAKVDTALKRALRQLFTVGLFDQPSARPPRVRNTKGYSSTYLAMGFANARAGTQTRRGVFGYPPEH